jgi:hypothetical protein
LSDVCATIRCSIGQRHREKRVDTKDRTRENRLRRLAYRRGERVIKLRGSMPYLQDFEYLVVDGALNAIVFKAHDLDELDGWFKGDDR